MRREHGHCLCQQIFGLGSLAKILAAMNYGLSGVLIVECGIKKMIVAPHESSTRERSTVFVDWDLSNHSDIKPFG